MPLFTLTNVWFNVELENEKLALNYFHLRTEGCVLLKCVTLSLMEQPVTSAASLPLSFYQANTSDSRLTQELSASEAIATLSNQPKQMYECRQATIFKKLKESDLRPYNDQ